jgi:hypothetical protein
MSRLRPGGRDEGEYLISNLIPPVRYISIQSPSMLYNFRNIFTNFKGKIDRAEKLLAAS